MRKVMKSEIFKGGVEQSCLISALVDIFSFFGLSLSVKKKTNEHAEQINVSINTFRTKYYHIWPQSTIKYFFLGLFFLFYFIFLLPSKLVRLIIEAMENIFI